MSKADSSPFPVKRANRDKERRRDTAAPSSQNHTDAPGAATATQGSVGDVLARGHAGLRFPPALEAQFERDSLAPRRKYLLICALVGILGIYIGCLNNDLLMPDIAARARFVINCYLAAAAFSVALNFAVPAAWRKAWHFEALTFVNAFGLNVAIIWSCTQSRADTVFTHSVTLIAAVMYACIAARLRFRWAFACAVLSFIGHVLFVEGVTPEQALIVAANSRLLAVSFVFVLAANYVFEYNERRNWLLHQLEEQERMAMEQASARVALLSMQDPLTGLFNRRQFDAELERAWTEARLSGEPIAMLMVDVDFFKRYNDTYGHPAGDACLVRVAEALSATAADHHGVAGRLGGEEFALLLKGRSVAEAQAVGERLCARVREARIEHRASSVSDVVTVSVGVAATQPVDDQRSAVLPAAADRALYVAKTGGRNRVGVNAEGTDDAQLTAGSPEEAHGAPTAAMATQPAAASTLTHTRHAEVLRKGFRWLRFPASLEHDYRAHGAEQRRRHLTLSALIGLLVYNLYVVVSLPLLPDVRGPVLVSQLGLSAVVLLLTFATARLPLGVMAREALHAVGACAAALLSVWALSQSTQLLTLSYSVSLILLPLFVGIGARMPFWFTLGPALLTLLAYVLMINPSGATQQLVFMDNVYSVGNTVVYTLIAAYTMEYSARKHWLLAHVERAQRDALAEATQRLHGLSLLDPLTGMGNRRHFETELQRVWLEGQRHPEPVALLIIDIDFFKAYNDGYGHPAGDRCLKQVATVLMDTAHMHDGVAARLGGEEFGILLPGRSLDAATTIGQATCEALRQAAIEHRFSSIASHVTASIGAASTAPQHHTARELMAAADKALYDAKTSGRNRVGAAQALQSAD